MKELVRKMTIKEPKKKKPKLKPNMTPKQRFIAYAKEVVDDESGERFERAMDTIVPKKKSE